MVRIIAVASGKGGVGKTTIAANLGLSLQRLGRRVVVVDCNLTTAHLGLMFGIYNYPVTLNNYLRDEARLENILYRHSSGLNIVPASLNLQDLVDIEVEDFKKSLKYTFSDYDFVILDSAPGLGREALISLQTADEILFVATPTIPSLVDILKQDVRDFGR
jgi:septum site-determining protein MinD